MGRKALFFDIDGTILSEITQTIPESARKAILKARENGHLTFVNTGRTRACVPVLVKEVGFDGLLCGCGTEVFYHGKTISRFRLQKEKCTEIANKILEAGVGAILEGDEFYFAIPDRKAFAFMKNGGGLNDGSMTLHFDWKPEEALFDKLVFFFDDQSDVKMLLDYFADEFDIIDRHNLFEIVPKGYTKAGAIRQVQDTFQIALEDCYVFGDSSNDFSMFEYCPNAIAMGKHDPMLEPYSSYIADTVEKDGLYKAMEALGLI